MRRTLCTAGPGPARASGTERSESAKSVTPATAALRGGRVQAQMRTGAEPSAGADVRAASLVSVCRCGWGEPDLGVAGVSPVPVSMVQGLRTVGYCEYSRSTFTGPL